MVDRILENFVRDNRPVRVDLGIGQVEGQEDHEEETGGIADQDILG